MQGKHRSPPGTVKGEEQAGTTARNGFSAGEGVPGAGLCPIWRSQVAPEQSGLGYKIMDLCINNVIL